MADVKEDADFALEKSPYASWSRASDSIRGAEDVEERLPKEIVF